MHIMLKFLHNLGTGSSLPKTTLRAKINWVRARGACKMWGPLFISATVEASNFKFGIQLGRESSLPRNNFYDENWQGARLGEHPKNFGTPYLFLQPLKLATSNLVYNLGLGKNLPRNNFYDQNWRGSGLGEHPKNLGPLIMYAIIEASNFKFGIILCNGKDVHRCE